MIPNPFTYKDGSLQAPGASATFTSSQLISATYISLPLGTGLTITYVVTVDSIAQPSSLLTNTAVVSHTSLPGASPDERTGSGVGPNNYYTSTQAVVSTADLSVTKVLHDPRNYTIGEAITYSILITVPTGLTRNLVFTDSIPAGLRYISPTSFLTLTAPFVLPTYTLTRPPRTAARVTQSQLLHRALRRRHLQHHGRAGHHDHDLPPHCGQRGRRQHGEIKINAVTLTYVDADNNVETKSSSVPVTLMEPLLIVKKVGLSQRCGAGRRRLLPAGDLPCDHFHGACLQRADFRQALSLRANTTLAHGEPPTARSNWPRPASTRITMYRSLKPISRSSPPPTIYRTRSLSATEV